MQQHNFEDLLNTRDNFGKQMFTKKDIAEILSVSLSTVDNYLGYGEGQLHYIKFDTSKKSTIRIMKSDFIKFLNSKYPVKEVA